eukprot:GHVL01013731.1.p1 GENE.GHVL01013731.1~~GHVL01013731.1.p1  ORF type:complete len:548 (+),score=93.12 GHVL01013731.1:52-1695(+)
MLKNYRKIINKKYIIYISYSDCIKNEINEKISENEREVTLSWMQSGRVLAKQLYSSARDNARDDTLWKKYVNRTISMAPHMSPDDIVLTLYSFARIKYRDPRVISALSPYLSKHISQFSSQGISLIVNAYKKLNFRRYNDLELLINQFQEVMLTDRIDSQNVALMANALSHFQIQTQDFWKVVITKIPTLTYKMEPLHASTILAAMAGLDIRHLKTIQLLCGVFISKIDQLGMREIGLTAYSLAKLEYSTPRVTRALSDVIQPMLDKSIENDFLLGSRKDLSVFDLSCLSAVVFVFGAMWQGSAKLIDSCLVILDVHSERLSVHHVAQLKSVETNLCFGRPEIYDLLSDQSKRFLKIVKETEIPVEKVVKKESRWMKEIAIILKDMEVKVDRSVMGDSAVLNVHIPQYNLIFQCIGPYSFYSYGTQRTSFSKLQQKLLEFKGYKVVVVPYFEWNELKRIEDKYRYLFTIGRRVAAFVPIIENQSPFPPQFQNSDTGAVLSDGGGIKVEKIIKKKINKEKVEITDYIMSDVGEVESGVEDNLLTLNTS